MKEIRIAEIRAEIPAGGEALVLFGRPIVYDTPTEIHDPAGTYIEVIKKGALKKADLSDVHLFYNHDLNRVPLARTPNTMQLTVTETCLEFTATLPDTEEARAVYLAVKRGDLSGMSFAFKVPDGGDKYSLKTNMRTITKIERVYECSIVPYPAYPTTSVEARNTMLLRKGDDAVKRLQIMANQILKERW